MATRVSSPTFVGRPRELDRATAALARAREGQPALVLVAGEAGVGKTRFVHEVATQARGSGFRVLVGGCVQLGGEGLPFGAVIEALRGLAHDVSQAALDALAGTGRAELSRLMPDLAADGSRGPDTGRFDISAQGRLFEHLLRLLERLAESMPILLVIEDLHWADRSTLELLDFLVRNLHDGPVAIVATYRSDELHRRHPLVPFLAEMERLGRVERIELGRFDRVDLARQLEGILGVPPEPAEVDRILARSGGNAFYAEELVAAGAAGGRLPDTLREVLLARVSTLSEGTQELLRVASAAGPEIAPALLATVSGTRDPGLTAALREAVTHQILVERAENPGGRYAFRHALVQEAVYGDLLSGERASLHAAFARALTEDEYAYTDASKAAALAYHWRAAHDTAHAFDAEISAGIAAEAIYAFGEAGSHYERALQLWDQVPDAAARAPIKRVALLQRAAAALEGTAPARSVGYVRAAIALLDPAIEPTQAGLLYERLGQYSGHLLDGATSLAACQEAVRLVPASPPSMSRARVLAGLGRCLYFMHRHRESASACEESVAIARSVDARTEESRALTLLASNLVVLGEVEAALAHARRARQIAMDLGDVYEVGSVLTWASGQLVNAGMYEAAVVAGLEARAYVARHGLAARFGSTDLSNAASGLIALGRWEEAAEALDLALRQGGPPEPGVEPSLLLLEALRGQFESAAQHARRARLQAERTNLFFGSLTVPLGFAELALWQGDPLAARTAIQNAAAMFEPDSWAHVPDVGWACALGIRAEADLARLADASQSQSDPEASQEIARMLLSRMRSLAADVATSRPYYIPRAEAWRATCEAEFSRLEGRPDPELWAATAVAWRAFRMPYFEAYSLMREAEAALARERDRRRAVGALTAARAIAVSLGADPLLRAVDDLAARVVGRPDGASGKPAHSSEQVKAARAQRFGRGLDIGGAAVGGRPGLTPRERNVLMLVAAGRSDGEIAQALFITKKTASSHVAHIKDKLEAHSRVEIATIAFGLGLVEVPTATA